MQLVLVGTAHIEQRGDQLLLAHQRDHRLDVQIPRKGARPRLVVLGGSSVRRGPGPGTISDFPTRLAELLPDVEVLNLGSPGQSMGGVAKILGELGPVQADRVLLYEGHNDFAQVVFMGGVYAAPLWQLPFYALTGRSWIYLTVKHLVLPVPPDTSGMTSASRLLITADRTALDARVQVLDLYAQALKDAVDQSPAPVIFSTMLRNFDAPPTGVLVAGDTGPCSALLRQPELEQTAVETACGQGSLSEWLAAQQAVREGRKDEALSHWRRSLALDPLPIRAPLEADDLIREVQGAMVVDPATALGPLPRGQLFSDVLHPSADGALALAQVLAPAVRQSLGR